MIKVSQENTVEITKSSINQLFQQKSITLPLTNQPLDTDYLMVRINPETDAMVLGYIVTDCDATWDGWPLNATTDDEIGLEGLLMEFTSEMDRDEAIEALKKKGHQPFIVDRFEHGLVHYTVADTVGYPYRQFDTAPCGVYVLDDVSEQMLKDGQITEGQAKDIANRTLDDYSQFCNGEVFVCVTEELKLDDKGNWSRIAHDELIGQIGSENAMKTLKNELMTHTVNPAELRTKTNSFDIN